MSALKSALGTGWLGGDGWLNADTSAAEATGRAPQTAQNIDIPAPAVPVADPSLPVEVPGVAPDATESVPQGGGWAPGKWGGFTQGGWKQGPAYVPEGDGGNAYENVLARPVGSVQQTLNEYAGYDAHSQATDDKGWNQYTPTGRTAVRRLLWADDVGYRLLWPVTRQRPTPVRVARTAVPNNSPDGTPGILNGATLPDFASLANGGPGNIAYETPGPPETVTAQTYGLSLDKWGRRQ